MTYKDPVLYARISADTNNRLEQWATANGLPKAGAARLLLEWALKQKPALVLRSAHVAPERENGT